MLSRKCHSHCTKERVYKSGTQLLRDFFSCLFVLKKATGKFAQENQEISQNSFCIHSISFLLKQDFDMHLKIVGFTTERRLHWAGGN